MARKSSSKTARSERHRSLMERAVPFAPPWCLACAVPAVGEALHGAWGGDPVTTPLATLGMTAATGALSWLTWGISLKAKREALIRWHNVATMALLGAAETGTMIVGLHRPWLDIVCGVAGLTAFSWNLRRFDSLRSETSENTEVEQDELAKKLGLAKTIVGKPKAIGARVEIPLKHRGGETPKDAQAALPAIEAVAGAPAGRSRVTPDPDNGGQSTLTLVMADVLKERIDWPGPNSPGGCITEPIESGRYEDDLPVCEYIAGGDKAVNNTNYGSMGVTRAGKTLNTQVKTVTMMSRRNVVIWWFDKVKGAQTAGPLLPGLDIAVLDDQVAAAKAGIAALKRILDARVRVLGECGYRTWTPAAFDDPRLRMPYLVAHFEEADVLLAAAGQDFVYLVSKCLSAGISIGISLQRADHASMDTRVRFNVSAWNCFGCGDDYSAQFALSDFVVQAGAHPENWKANKPGYFYHEGPGVDEQRYAVPARSYFATDDQLAAVAAEWAPRMARLDEVSVAAAGDWYAAAKQQMAADAGGATKRGNATVTSQNSPNSGWNTDGDEDSPEAIREEMRADLEEIRAEIPRQPEPGFATNLDPSRPIPAYTGADMQFGGKPEAVSQKQAEDAFDQLIRAMALDEDKERVQVGELVERFPYRSRPWMSKRLSALADGQAVIEPGIVLERVDDQPGHYYLRVMTNVAVLHGA